MLNFCMGLGLPVLQQECTELWLALDSLYTGRHAQTTGEQACGKGRARSGRHAGSLRRTLKQAADLYRQAAEYVVT